MSHGHRAALVLVLSGVVSCSQLREGAAPGAAVDSGAASDSAVASSDSAAVADSGSRGDSSARGDSTTARDSGPAGDTGGSSSCDGSTCGIESVVSGLFQAGVLTLDDTNVYVQDQGTTTGEVYQCPKTGCTTPTQLGPGYATGLAVDKQNVYWNDFGGGQIVSCAIGGCANSPTVIAPNQAHAEGLSFDGTNLYWATMGTILTCAAPGCLSPSTLASGQSSVITQTSAETDVVYWISSGALLGCGAGGCAQTPMTIASSVANGSEANGSLIVQDGFVYYTSGNSIVSCPVTSACQFPRTIGASSAPFGLASDGTNVYWLDENIAQVYRCSIVGCLGSADVFADQTSLDPAGEIGTNIALDGEYVYWADPTNVYRKHK